MMSAGQLAAQDIEEPVLKVSRQFRRGGAAIPAKDIFQSVLAVPANVARVQMTRNGLIRCVIVRAAALFKQRKKRCTIDRV